MSASACAPRNTCVTLRDVSASATAAAAIAVPPKQQSAGKLSCVQIDRPSAGHGRATITNGLKGHVVLLYQKNDLSNLFKNLRDGLALPPVNQSASQSLQKIDHKNILPNFDPSSNNQRMDVWLKEVNERATVYGWDERTTTHFAMQKLQGLAKTWYESLNTILFTWPEWQDKLLSAFPCEQNYGQTLEDMSRRKSRYSEPIEVYYYERLSLA